MAMFISNIFVVERAGFRRSVGGIRNACVVRLVPLQNVRYKCPVGKSNHTQMDKRTKSETTESGMCYRECNTAVRCSRDGTRGTLKLMRMKEGKFVIVTEYGTLTTLREKAIN